MNLRLTVAIQMLHEDRRTAARRLEEYWELQKGQSSDSAQTLRNVIEQFRILERIIVKALSELRPQSTRTHSRRVT